MTWKTTSFEGWSWFKFNNLGLALRMTLKFHTSVAKVLKLKLKKFCGLSPTFVEVTGKKLVGGPLWPPLPSPPPILNRVNVCLMDTTLNKTYLQSTRGWFRLLISLNPQKNVNYYFANHTETYSIVTWWMQLSQIFIRLFKWPFNSRVA